MELDRKADSSDKAMRRICSYMSALLLAVSCSRGADELMPSTAEKMIMDIAVKSADASAGTPVFIFWDEAYFSIDDFGGKAPYHVSYPTGVTDAYDEVKYNTGKDYPGSYRAVKATGYAPSTLARKNDGWTEMTLGTSHETGKTDVLVAAEAIQGSSLRPFDEKMEFIHAQIRFTAKAELSETMAKAMKDVTLEVNGKHFMSGLRWSNARKRYVPTTFTDESEWIMLGKTEYQLSSDRLESIGDFLYISAPEGQTVLTELLVRIRGKIADDNVGLNNNPIDFEVTTTVAVEAVDGSDNPVEVGENDSYELTLTFDEDRIEISGNAMPWTDGGNIIVPVRPLPTEGL